MHDEKDTSNYNGLVLEAICNCLKDGPKSFWEIVRGCRGAYPTVVSDVLKHSKTNVFANPNEAMYALDAISRSDSILDSLEGNPVLSSWYFSDNACRKAEQLSNWRGFNLAFLGTPKLFEWFSMRRLGDERLLIDLDSKVLEALSRTANESDSLVKHDLIKPLSNKFRGKFDFIFLDPPWYFSDYLVWISRALEISRNGTMLISLFPDLTRPTARKEREHLIDLLSFGCRITILFTGFWDYQVPTFEAEELIAQSLTPPKSWKTSDLLLVNGLRSSIVFENESHESPKFSEIDFGHIRVFVLDNVVSNAATSLLSLPSNHNAILASRSMRNRH